jgi:hypothetical protein
MGCWRGLATRGFRRLASFSGALGACLGGPGACVRLFNAARRKVSPGSDADQEGVEFGWDVELVQEEVTRGVDSP